MKTLQCVRASDNPLELERHILHQLKASYSLDDNLQVRVLRRRLVIDGLVADMACKFEVERACRSLAPGKEIVNRLRVGFQSDALS